MKEAAGTLLYRYDAQGALLVLLVHPSGSYNRHAPWGIPKGLLDPGEGIEDAARRETWEETGLRVEQLVSLGAIEYTKSRKRVHAFAGTAAGEPRCASWEIDGCEYLAMNDARLRIHPDQSPFLDRLEVYLHDKPPA